MTPRLRLRLAATATIAIAFITGILTCHSRTSSPADPPAPQIADTFESPRLAALARELELGHRPALDAFWKEIQGNAPLIEPIPGDPRAVWVTFLWHGDANTRRMNVLGGPATNDFAAWMQRLDNTDLWYRTDRIPADARFVYRFQVNRPLKFPPDADKRPPLAPPHPDPFNPHPVPSFMGSLAELPHAPPEPWLQPVRGQPVGRVTHRTFRSAILNQDRRVSIYTPPGDASGNTPCTLLLLFDAIGSQPADLLPAPTILDNLITQKKLPPTVAVLIHQVDRNRELCCSPQFSDFVATELVPWVRKNYRVANEPTHAIIGGISLGGLMAAYCGYRHSETFGNVLSLSGSFQWLPGLEDGRVDSEPGWLTRQLLDSPRLPIRFHLAVGSFENYWPFSQIAETRRLRDVLLAKSYSVSYHEFPGGHEQVSWRSPFVAGLIDLTHTR